MSVVELFQEQKRLLNDFFDRVDAAQAQRIVDELNRTEGVIFFTGVGKSALVAQKIATTMASVNIRALYISAVDAIHGDLGLITEKDVVVFLSKSGESDELLHLVPFARNKKAKLIAVTSDPGSRLAKGCDESMRLPIEKELCPFGLMPTTSSAVQMLFGDIIATEMMTRRGLEIEEYRLNHPAGKIGRRMTIRVSDLMKWGEDLPLCSPNMKLIDIFVDLSDKQCGCMLVVEKEKLVGILTDGDLRRALQKHGEKALHSTLSELMTANPRTIQESILAVDALEFMETQMKSPITVLPVLKGDELVGLIRLHDILQSGV